MQHVHKYSRRLRVLAAALLIAGCSEGPRNSLGLPELAITTGSHAALDKFNGSLNQSGSILAKGFDPENPALGSTIIATFTWQGSTNIVDSVVDFMASGGGPPPGNVYRLVDYTTAGGVSMATYVATNVQGFPSPNQGPTHGVLAVRAHLSEPVTNGGMTISAFTGLESDPARALGEHRAAAGQGSSTTVVSPGAILPQPGALIYGATVSDGLVGIGGPSGWNNLATQSDAVMKTDVSYAVAANADSVAPQWTWHFNSPSTWLASAIALNPAPGQILRLNGTFSESGSTLCQGFYPTNPLRGDAIVATFFWVGSTNVIDSVTDQLDDGTPVGNRYQLVEYVTRDGIAMATYVATNVRNFPDPNPPWEQVLLVQAHLSTPVSDGGVLLSAYTGVERSLQQALGEHQSVSDTASSTVTVGPGPINVSNGDLVYAVTLSNGLVGIEGAPGMTNISTMTDSLLKGDAQYVVTNSAGPVSPQWTWYFDAPRTWVATVLTLKPH